MNNEELIQRIKKVRKDHGLSQLEFSKALKVTQGHISNMENGTKNIAKSFLKNLCLEFNVNDKWLISGEGNPYIENDFLAFFKNRYGFTETDENFFKTFCRLNRKERDNLYSFLILAENCSQSLKMKKVATRSSNPEDNT